MTYVFTTSPDPAGSGRRARRLVLLLAGLAAASCLVGCYRRNQQQAQTPSRPPALVTTATAIARDTPVYLEQIGKTLAMEIVTIVPQVGGKLIAAHVRDGAYVHKGDLLFEIDPRPFEAALASAEAALAEDKAALALAQSELARIEGAVAMNAVSKMQYDQKKSAVAIAEAKIDSGEAAVRTARLNLEYTRIYSPITGRAGALLVHPGNVVKENSDPLLIIQRLDPIYVAFTVNENDLGTVRRYMTGTGVNPGGSTDHGLKVEVEIPADSVRVSSAVSGTGPATRPEANPAEPRVGTLTFLDNTVQSQTGTAELRATVPNSDYHFWPGQFVKCRLVLTTLKNAVLVPAAAQQISQQGPYVYVVRPDHTAELRLIRPGQRQGDLIVIEQGLKADEKVIVSGHMTVMPNGKVREVDDPDAVKPNSMHQARASTRG